MKKYTLYAWFADDEGGTAVCLTKDFTPMRNYNPESGCHAMPSEKLGEFNTLDELSQLLFDTSDGYYISVDEARKEDGEYFFQVCLRLENEDYQN